ncbi:MAG: hypothetical protein CSA81_02630 [Acidobacteria bacterium]|nr:MAG: hypothetical protein CSA81_02630 [Acidobacteriota bacterium]
MNINLEYNLLTTCGTCGILTSLIAGNIQVVYLSQQTGSMVSCTEMYSEDVFTDVNFRAYIKDKYGVEPSETEIPRWRIECENKLFLSPKNCYDTSAWFTTHPVVSGLDGIEFFTGLKNLVISQQNLGGTTLDFTNLTQLETAVIMESGLSNYPVFPPSVKTISLNHNSLTAPVPESYKSSNIMYLDLSNNQIDTISNLNTSLPAMKYLELHRNLLDSADITDIKGILDTNGEHLRVSHYRQKGNEFLNFTEGQSRKIAVKVKLLTGTTDDYNQLSSQLSEWQTYANMNYQGAGLHFEFVMDGPHTMQTTNFRSIDGQDKKATDKETGCLSVEQLQRMDHRAAQLAFSSVETDLEILLNRPLLPEEVQALSHSSLTGRQWLSRLNMLTENRSTINLYILDFDDIPASAFAHFPGVAFYGEDLIDYEVVFTHSIFADYSHFSTNGKKLLGSVISHELGHFFGLVHTHEMSIEDENGNLPYPHTAGRTFHDLGYVQVSNRYAIESFLSQGELFAYSQCFGNLNEAYNMDWYNTDQPLEEQYNGIWDAGSCELVQLSYGYNADDQVQSHSAAEIQNKMLFTLDGLTNLANLMSYWDSWDESCEYRYSGSGGLTNAQLADAQFFARSNYPEDVPRKDLHAFSPVPVIESVTVAPDPVDPALNQVISFTTSHTGGDDGYVFLYDMDTEEVLQILPSVTSGEFDPVEVNPARTMKLYAVNNRQITSQDINLVQLPVVISFTAAPTTINSGESSTLSWETVNADYVELSGIAGPFPATGQVVVSPASTTSYTLTAINGNGSSSDQVSVTVNGGGSSSDAILGNLLLVNAGTFTQGTATDPCRDHDETPFTHTLTRNFLAMETEITRQMWADLKALQPSLPDDPTNTNYGAGMNHPVQSVQWYEAVLFANLLSLERGLTRCYYKDAAFTDPVVAGNHTSGSFYCNFNANGYRLPTEGEWEYMARAGTSGPFSIDEPNYNSGSCGGCVAGTLSSLESVAWFCGNSYDPAGNNTTKPVGLKNPNPWGLKDVHGNVREWCWDYWYSTTTYPTGSVTDYTGPASGVHRVSRGGCCWILALRCRSADRGRDAPDYRYGCLGFRLVRNYP